MPFAICIDYLSGYAVATDPASRDLAEWPPHPARVAMALAAAHFETGEDPAERRALEWLEILPPPRIACSEASARSVRQVFVPVNDKPTGKGPMQTLSGLTRSRQGRTFPTVRPDDPRVFLIWRTEPDGHREALGRLCAKVTRIGHSSSMVQLTCRSDELPEATWIPDGDTPLRHLRVVSGGTLAYLEQQFNKDEREAFDSLLRRIHTSKGKARTGAKAEFERRFGRKYKKNAPAPPSNRPNIGLWHGYARPRREQPAVPGSMWHPELLILRLVKDETSCRHLDLVATLQVARSLTNTIISKAPDPVPEHICGHRPDGSPSEAPHLAVVPLPFVGRPHADGHLLGLGIALPQGLEPAERREAWGAAIQATQLRLGRLGLWKLLPEVREVPPHTLRADTWASSRGARRWATVTPIAFDRHPKVKQRDAYERAVAAMIADACTRIGLPEPVEVGVTRISPHLGVPPAGDFPRLRRKDDSRRRHVHAIIQFGERVRGPILLGAGRYRGYGLCRPLGG